MPDKKGNLLSESKSPYLLQHATNPVHWQAWSEDAFAKARKEDKLVLVSIGYSACHWCHVMEKESFEDPGVARIMNDHFISIKVDREEHPDVDHLYMEAVQIMTGSGGWPLNCFVLPDKRPVYGGTYFPKEDWKAILTQLSELFQKDKDKLLNYAEKLTDSLSLPVLEHREKDRGEIRDALNNSIREIPAKFDHEWGGTIHVPKFPVPVSLQFLLKAGRVLEENLLEKHVFLTLKTMAEGGIFDHLGGGFARYSTDRYWKVPHFEKMLYDNGQLLSVYSAGFSLTNDKSFMQVIDKTFRFFERELLSETGAYYSALDADTEGEEGKFYVWTREEIREILGSRFEKFSGYYRLEDQDEWEHENFVLNKKRGFLYSPDDVATLEDALFSYRSNRPQPAVDNKIIASWNALAIGGLADAYLATGKEEFKNAALRTAGFFTRHELLFHCYSGEEGYINGYLEDYALMASACLSLNQITADPDWLLKAKAYAEKIIHHFYDSELNVFHLSTSSGLPVPVTDLFDSVMPSAPGMACVVLFKLGRIFEINAWEEIALKTSTSLLPTVENHPLSFGNWGMLLLDIISDPLEIVVTGKDADLKLRDVLSKNHPTALITGSNRKMDGIPLFKNRFGDETQIFVCKSKSCFQPVKEAREAFSLLHWP